MPRGGSRNGAVGKAYANRTDLQTGSKPLPITAVPGQPYGAAGQQMAAQASVPMAPTSIAPAQPEAPMGTMAGELPSLMAPSDRPHEPLTHGLAVGPGGGPEVFPQEISPVLKGLSILNTLPNLPPELAAVARFLNVSQTNGSGE